MTTTAIPPRGIEFKLPTDPGKEIRVPDPADLVPLPREIPKAEKKPEGETFGTIPEGKLTGASKPKGSMDAPPVFGTSRKVEKQAEPAPQRKSNPDSKYYDGPIRS